MFLKVGTTTDPNTRTRSHPPPRRNIPFLLLVTLAFCFGTNHNSILSGLPTMPAVAAMRSAATTTLRRSARLRGLPSTLAATAAPEPVPDPPKKAQKRTRSTAAGKKTNSKKSKTATKPKKKTTTKKAKDDSSTADELWCLPRTRESSILSSTSKVRFVMGVDEAGRGPLAGPVVAAAAIVPQNIDGITDSKKITKEQDREDLYKAITESPNVRWAVAVMDAAFIDKVNILQATMRGMEAASTALAAEAGASSFVVIGDEKVPVLSEIDHEQDGCYVVTSYSSSSDTKTTSKNKKSKEAVVNSPEEYRALVDGNRIPPGMPCESESIVKGDSKEYGIAAASILAKVSRDRLMRAYHELWPHFGLEKHKGYPTAAHMAAVRQFGASRIHRRTFKPLKEMTFDKDGKILTDNN